MQVKSLLTPSEKIKNPFDGRDANEVWAELKAKAKPVDKEALIKAMLALKKSK